MFKSLSLTGSHNESFSTHHQSGSQLDASTRDLQSKVQLNPYNYVDIDELLYICMLLKDSH